MTVLFSSPRLQFGLWQEQPPSLAHRLWGDEQVTRYITAGQIDARLRQEIAQYQRCGLQYFPLFTWDLTFIGVCGLRPYDQSQNILEAGVHLLPDYWHVGYAQEAMQRVMEYGIVEKGATALFAGHHPKNTASRALLLRLGFVYDHDAFYPPTGLYHPSYFYRPCTAPTEAPPHATGGLL